MTRKQQIEQAWLHGDAEQLTSFRLGAEWADEHPKNPWISVEDRLPEDDRDYLFMGNHIPLCLGRYYSNSLSGAIWSCDDGYWTPAKEVTHWMPIPELEKGE